MNFEVDNFCFVCGKENPCGLKLSFLSDKGKITATYTSQRMHQGYKDITHGGIITALLDEAMIHAAISLGMAFVTAEICVRFKKPLTVNTETLIEAEITRKSSRLIEASARLLDKDSGDVIAEAHSKLIPSKWHSSDIPI